MKRVVISDTHIGTKFYKSEELLAFLENLSCDELILAGDIIDFIKIPVFTERCLQIIEKMKAPRVIYVVGNHDEGLLGVVGNKVMGVEFVKRYEFEEDGRVFRIEHGDAYDKGVLHNRIFVKFLSVIQNMLEFTFNFDFTTWWTSMSRPSRGESVSSSMLSNAALSAASFAMPSGLLASLRSCCRLLTGSGTGMLSASAFRVPTARGSRR